MPKVFCIDGVVIDIPDSAVTHDRLRQHMLEPIEFQPIMAGVLYGKDIALLTPLQSDNACEEFGGMMLEDINLETFHDVSVALKEHGEAPQDGPEYL